MNTPKPNIGDIVVYKTCLNYYGIPINGFYKAKNKNKATTPGCVAYWRLKSLKN